MESSILQFERWTHNCHPTLSSILDSKHRERERLPSFSFLYSSRTLSNSSRIEKPQRVACSEGRLPMNVSTSSRVGSIFLLEEVNSVPFSSSFMSPGLIQT